MHARKIVPFQNTQDDRLMLPQAIEVEEEVLGELLLDPNAIHRVGGLESEAFYSTANREIYEAILALHEANEPIDLMSVTVKLHERGKLAAAGGQARLSDLVDPIVHAVNIDYHAAILTEKLHRRRLIAVGQELLQIARDTSRKVQEVQAEAESKVFSLSHSSQQKGLQRISDVLVSEAARIESISNGSAPTPGILSGFYDLDAITKGYKRHQLIVVAGRPSMGKTTWALSNARNIAGQGKAVAVFSLEMGADEIAETIWASDAGIESGRLASGRIDPVEWEPLGSALCKLSNVPLYIDDSANITPQHVISQCRRLRVQEEDLGLIVVDYLGLMAGGEGSANYAIEVGKITRAFKLATKELRCPIMLISQLNRSVENRSEKRPMMSDLRDSGCVEQDADLIIMLYRDEYYNPDTPDRGIAELGIVKHRKGATGKVKLLFEPQFGRFKNLAGGRS